MAVHQAKNIVMTRWKRKGPFAQAGNVKSTLWEKKMQNGLRKRAKE
jgi:hypothetical protein